MDRVGIVPLFNSFIPDALFPCHWKAVSRSILKQAAQLPGMDLGLRSLRKVPVIEARLKNILLCLGGVLCLEASIKR